MQDLCEGSCGLIVFSSLRRSFDGLLMVNIWPFFHQTDAWSILICMSNVYLQLHIFFKLCSVASYDTNRSKAWWCFCNRRVPYALYACCISSNRRRGPTLSFFFQQLDRPYSGSIYVRAWLHEPGWCQFAGISARLLNATKLNFAITWQPGWNFSM